jgi:truncated hemoglobin YjbI
MKTHLDRFYKLVAKNPALARQFDEIVERTDFSKLAVQLGAKWGYTFTHTELQNSIESTTATGQGEYFCLPLGCWQKIQSV